MQTQEGHLVEDIDSSIVFSHLEMVKKISCQVDLDASDPVKLFRDEKAR